MKRILVLCSALMVGGSMFAGCNDRETKTTNTEKISGPGGTTTTTTETTIKSTGDNPPVNSQGETVPPKK